MQVLTAMRDLIPDEIPLLGRIVSVADAFDAMTSNRPYHEFKKGRPPAWAFAEVERQAGRQFDPRCAAAFIEMREQVVRAMLDLTPGAEVDENVVNGEAEEYVPDPRN